MSEKTIVGLTVKESKVRGSRTVRFPKALFGVLQIEKGEKVVISSGKKTRIVRSYGSELVEDGVIYLRRSDMKTLDVQEGDMIRVDRLVPVSKIVKEKTKPTTKKIKKGLTSIKKRLKGEEKEEKGRDTHD